MKESISDIINQLQDIDPSRLSFSPFLDLDTQISLAPVSDSPESSVEELHSLCPSVSGSTPSLEPTATTNHNKSLPRNCQRPINNNTLPKGPPSKEPPSQHPRSPPVSAAPADPPLTEKCMSTPRQETLPNGTDSPRWSPETPTLVDCPADDSASRPLISPPPESVELSMWTSPAPVVRAESCPAVEEGPVVGGSRGCCCHCCKCCQGARVPAFLSILGSLLCAVAVMYALYFHVPLKPPRFTDVSSRMVFTLCCCAVASVPILLAMLVGALCQFCSGSLELSEAWPPSRRSVQQLFISSSLELLLLYGLNLLIMAALLPNEHLMMVPVMAVMFVLGRLVYWVSLNVCSPWRGFGSGLTMFPLLASVALNLFLMYNTLNSKQALFGS